ncbi:putative amino-acid permease meu22 [Neolecta irregularis DAH-3]|uniref:Putative amino-acid permease meu22 n=1 Tax=Neolecta irregularis (strain DAH-3) TaxID=1198029 RepID=A0A1U7LSL6_NEOID|nr:putative amino-acid permease meu22 [Neolecta irregularis DAH-3]|eukprot:OLL25511.1 putative amino-acid permease meu22 [Neolecta irregularis DAH-3]
MSSENEKHLASPKLSSQETGQPLERGLRRRLNARQIFMVSVGSSIGQGLWVGSGASLAQGGPASLLLGFVFTCIIVFLMMQSVGELSTAFPVASAFSTWASQFVDEALGFALGWIYCFLWMTIIAAELTGANTIIRYWTTAVPVAVWISLFMLVFIGINFLGVKGFGDAETVFTTVKLTFMFIVIISCIIISTGAAPKGDPIGFKYWSNPGPFKNGIKGFFSTFSTSIFALTGAELTGIIAGESANPKQAVPRAANSVWIRLCFFYILGSWMVTMVVSSSNDQLLGGSGVNASPFVIALKAGGLGGLAHIMNAVILISVLSCGNSALYAGSRTLVGLANVGLAPKFFAKCDKSGRPNFATLFTAVLGGAMGYLNVSNSGATVFMWFSSLATLATIWAWWCIFLAHIRFRRAMRLQGRSLDSLAWKTSLYPWGAYFGIAACTSIFFIQFYLAVWPLKKISSASNFFTTFLSFPLFLVLYFSYRLWFRTSFVKLDKMDLDTGRLMHFQDEEVVEKEKATGFGKIGEFIWG